MVDVANAPLAKVVNDAREVANKDWEPLHDKKFSVKSLSKTTGSERVLFDISGGVQSVWDDSRIIP